MAGGEGETRGGLKGIVEKKKKKRYDTWRKKKTAVFIRWAVFPRKIAGGYSRFHVPL